MKKKRLLIMALSVFMLIIFSGCCFKHDWQPATCTQPETCSKCEKTRGEALGHTWVAATCTEPKTCSVCGATSGTALGHEYDVKRDDFICTSCKEERLFTYNDMNEVLYGIKSDYGTFKETYMDKYMVMEIRTDGKGKAFHHTGIALVDGDSLYRTVRNPNDESESIWARVQYVAKDEKDLDSVGPYAYLTVRAKLDEVMSGFSDKDFFVTFDNMEILSDGWQSTKKN